MVVCLSGDDHWKKTVKRTESSPISSSSLSLANTEYGFFSAFPFVLLHSVLVLSDIVVFSLLFAVFLVSLSLLYSSSPIFPLIISNAEGLRAGPG